MTNHHLPATVTTHSFFRRALTAARLWAWLGPLALWLMLGGYSHAAAPVSGTDGTQQSAADATSAAMYACPMHPEVTSHEAGRCPICGMDLVLQHANDGAMPQHMHQHSDHEHLAVQADNGEVFACPMHPEVTSHEAGRCPICGMNLVKQEMDKATPKPAEQGQDITEAEPAGTPGTTPVTAPVTAPATTPAPAVAPATGQALIPEVRSHGRAPLELLSQGFKRKPQAPVVASPYPASPAPQARLPAPAAVVHADHDHNHDHDHNNGDTAAAEVYVCPMHPQIVRDAPGRCPICGMDLVKRLQEKTTGDADHVLSLPGATVQNLGVRTAAVERGSMQQQFDTLGYVDYNRDRLTQVRARTHGWVENLSLRHEGLPVKRGQLLLEFYAPEYLRAQEAFLEAQKRDQSDPLKSYQARKESVEPREFLRYLEIPESALNELARSGKPRLRIPVYAPHNGTVISYPIHKNMYLAPGDEMFTVADLSSVTVEADVYERQVAWIKRGLRAEIEVDALPGEHWTGHISLVAPELDPQTRTLKVQLLVPNPTTLLKPNMFARVHIFGQDRPDLLKIPREALIVSGGQERVILALGEGRFKPVTVVSGMQSDGEVEILEGLQEGDQVVVSGQFLIDSEANLRSSLQRLDAERP